MAEPARGPAGLSPDDPRYEYQRTPRQAQHEAAMREVSETLMNIEQAVNRADRARRAVSEADENNMEVALATAKERLEAARKELFQSAYFSDPQQKLL